jgi:hypothetical protein
MAVMSDYAHAGARRGRGFFARLFDRMIEAREREAERLIKAHLASLDTDTLRQWGYDPKTLKWIGEAARRA